MFFDSRRYLLFKRKYKRLKNVLQFFNFHSLDSKFLNFQGVKDAFLYVYGDAENDDGDLHGYSKKMDDKGQDGYKHADKYHKKDGDKYGYEKHSEYGQEQKANIEKENDEGLELASIEGMLFERVLSRLWTKATCILKKIPSPLTTKRIANIT